MNTSIPSSLAISSTGATTQLCGGPDWIQSDLHGFRTICEVRERRWGIRICIEMTRVKNSNSLDIYLYLELRTIPLSHLPRAPYSLFHYLSLVSRRPTRLSKLIFRQFNLWPARASVLGDLTRYSNNVIFRFFYISSGRCSPCGCRANGSRKAKSSVF